MFIICDKNKCTGCFCCFNVCPRNAISMEEDKFGYIYPKIDTKKCINCNICKMRCPSNNVLPLNTIKKCYAGMDKNNKSREKSSSGGIAYILSKFIIKHGGIVYGASFESGLKVEHVRVDNLTCLEKLRGSKYVHSYINDTYKQAKEDLKTGKQVLFIGTPCQISGLKFYLGKNYDNLYLIDIICHGVPSLQFLKEEIGDIKNIDNIIFRENNNFYLSIFSKGKKIINKYFLDSPYYDGFLCGTTYRDNCYNCLYAQPKRIGDITLGDFWGLHDDSKLYDSREKGVSLILILNNKGQKLFNNISNEIIYEERNIQEAIDGNKQLRHPTKINRTAKKFKQKYIKGKFVQAYNRSHKRGLLYRKIKNILSKNKKIYKIYLKLKVK